MDHGDDLIEQTGGQKTFDLALLAQAHGKSPDDILAIVHGLLFAAGSEGLTSRQMARLFELDEDVVPALCRRLESWMANHGELLTVRRAGDVWELVTRSELAPYLRALMLAPPPPALSAAALETLAIIAYRQPITRQGVEEVRGVKCDHALGTLVARGLVCDVGRAEGPGRPFLYGTTREFLEYFGLEDLSQLPLLGVHN
ncbi:MAG: SMC-Scp complex subunit ScpB [Firmicutes bacterium]|nr:SMC-Scp complex subunit ScpB [Bacillota bacterium]